MVKTIQRVREDLLWGLPFNGQRYRQGKFAKEETPGSEFDLIEIGTSGCDRSFVGFFIWFGKGPPFEWRSTLSSSMIYFVFGLNEISLNRIVQVFLVAKI